MQTPRRAHLAIALLCMALGGFLILLASGVISDSQRQRHAPDFIVAFSGSAFIIAGCMVLIGLQSRFNDLFAAILCLLLGAIGAWVALFGPSEGFSGGLPLIPQEANVSLARWVFGIGSLMSFALSGWALKRFFRPVG
jgi:hypothetical protein